MSADTTPPPPRHKELLDEWISNNYEEYCDFTEMMHSVDGIGFERVFNFASKLAPGFKKAVILRMKDDRATDFKNLEEMMHEAKIGNKLLAGFENPLPDSMTTPMLAWLFCGRSFECMVELGEELIRSRKMSFLRRMAAKLLIKGIINSSISIDARTARTSKGRRKRATKQSDCIHLKATASQTRLTTDTGRNKGYQGYAGKSAYPRRRQTRTSRMVRITQPERYSLTPKTTDNPDIAPRLSVFVYV